MKKVEINIYEFDELKDRIKEKLIEAETEINSDMYANHFLGLDMEDKALELLKDYFNFDAEDIKDFRVYYSLGYCQGDGAMIEFKVEHDALVKHLIENKIINKREAKKIEYIDFQVKQSGHYYHEYAFTTYYHRELADGKHVEDIADKLDAYLDKTINDKIVDMNIELKKFGYECLEAEPDTESIIESLKQHNYYSDGEIYYDGE